MKESDFAKSKSKEWTSERKSLFIKKKSERKKHISLKTKYYRLYWVQGWSTDILLQVYKWEISNHKKASKRFQDTEFVFFSSDKGN